MRRQRRGNLCCGGRRRRLLLRWPSILQRRSGSVPVFYDRQDELEKYEFMMGEARGRLAVTLDVLTDALVLVGQHGVYCTSARNPKVPALDLQAVLANINGAKELVASVMGGCGWTAWSWRRTPQSKATRLWRSRTRPWSPI